MCTKEYSFIYDNTKLREVINCSNNHAYENMINHRSYTYNLSLKNNLGLNGFRFHVLCDTSVELYQLRYQDIVRS